MYLLGLARLGRDCRDGGSSSWISSPSLDSLEKAHGESGGDRAGVVGTSYALRHDGIGLSSPVHLW